TSRRGGGWRGAPPEPDPSSCSTYGAAGRLLDAIRRETKDVIVGLGGSVTNDGGFGMARALGYRFLNNDNVELSGPVSDLLSVEHIVSPPDLILPRVTAAADVRNPLLGMPRARRTFGPQTREAPHQ